MSEKKLEELRQYNLEYLEALDNENLYGGDYTSAVELKYVKKEIERLNNIIDELEWKPIDEYFKNKKNYDWVLVKYYDKYNFECIPSVAEYRFDKWYLKDNEKTLQDFEVRYFFDMQQLDKLKELKEANNKER